MLFQMGNCFHVHITEIGKIVEVCLSYTKNSTKAHEVNNVAEALPLE